MFSLYWQAGPPPAPVPQLRPIDPQSVDACQMLQPLALSVTQVKMSLPEHMVAFTAEQPPPAVAAAAGQMQLPPTQLLDPRQAVVPTATLQAGVLLSWPQITTVELFKQYELVPSHISGTHWQFAKGMPAVGAPQK